MEILCGVAEGATNSAISHVERECGHLIHFKRSTNTLKEQMEQLIATTRDVQRMMDAAVTNGELVKETVQVWMTRAGRVLDQATKLSDEASVINSWYKGWWCCGRFSLGRKAQKKILIIQGLRDERDDFGDNVSYRIPTQSLEMAVTEGFNAFVSRESTADEILKEIRNEATNLLGVYGMPGVGKTTLIKAIAKQVKEEHLFQEVVVVTVSQDPSLKKLQGDIAEKLDLKDLGDDLSTRADRLSERLNQVTKTTLVILDDVWDTIELSEVGIPKGKCCKVLITTRDQAVCNKMQANAQIEVALLSEEDSWILFRQKFGTVANSSIAGKLLSECGCLPLAIITLGLALRNKDEEVCADALQQLRKSNNEDMSYVDSIIKTSYNFLKNKQKVCFLFCCLFPEDHKIKLDVLLSYVMGEKLLEVDTYEDARRRLYSILDKLVSCGLLLRDEDGDVTMHDVVRDMAISIATKKERYIVKAGRNWSYWPDMELANSMRLSMMYNPIQHLPTIPIKAPFLQALFLNNNPSLTELPPDVFAEMKSLMTLDLSHTYIESLPPSLSCLENLNTLLLNETYSLINLSPIEKLEKLEVLSLVRTVKEFPEEMGNLSNLKVLDLTGTEFTNSINPNLISKFHQLETFHLLESNIYEPKPGNLEETEFFREVASLSRLESLQLSIYNPELYHTEIPGHWENFTRFQIMLNYEREDVCYSKSLILEGIQRGKVVAKWVLVLLGKTNYLRLQQCDDIESLTDELGGAEGMNHNLKHLELRNCPKMECLVNNTGLLESNENRFSNLEKLEIGKMDEFGEWKMDAFVEIYKGTNPAPRGLLCKLKTVKFGYCPRLLTAIPRKLIHNLLNLEHLHIRMCRNLLYVLETEEEEASSSSNTGRMSQPLQTPIFPNLKSFFIVYSKIRYVFTMRVARNLLLLDDLDINYCPEMEVILKYEDGENIKCDQDTSILPRLKKLYVNYAPNLKSFTNRNLVMELPSLEDLTVSECDILERLPFGATSVPNLKTIETEQELFHRLEWEDESVKSRLNDILQESKTRRN